MDFSFSGGCSATTGNLNPTGPGRLALGHDDLEDPVLVGGLDASGIGIVGQGDHPPERPVESPPGVADGAFLSIALGQAPFAEDDEQALFDGDMDRRRIDARGEGTNLQGSRREVQPLCRF